MNKIYFIHLIFLLLLSFLITGSVQPLSNISQLLAYFCLHSIGIVLIVSELEQSESFINIKIGSFIVISSIIILKSTHYIFSGSEIVMLLIMFFLNNLFVILATILLKSLSKISLQSFSIYRSLAISLNVLFMYLNISSPSNIFFTKWWLFGGIFYIPYIDSFGLSFWVSTIFISVSIIYLLMKYEQIKRLNNKI